MTYDSYSVRQGIQLEVQTAAQPGNVARDLPSPGGIAGWLEIFGTAAVRATKLASGYMSAVTRLQDEWRVQLAEHSDPRSNSAAWMLIDVLPVHPVITVAVAAASTGRTEPAVNNAVAEIVGAGILSPVSESKRSRAGEATGLLELVVTVETGSRV